jgi:predicted PurR-regulated permease PerM
VATLPEVAQKARRALQEKRADKPSTIDKVQEAANELEKVASAGTAAATGRTPAPPPPPKPRVNVSDFLWSGTLGLVALLGQTAVVFFITLFLLASGDTFRRKMVKLAGPRLSQKKITVQALDEISAHIQRFLFVQLATSVVVGVATGLAFYFIGLEHAAVWGIAAGVTNLIPYVGAVIVGVGAAVVGFMQFNAIDMGLFVGAVSFMIHAVVGNVLTPWWTGRSSRMNPFAVFVGVLAFGWLWGISGLLLGTPILMVVKTICDRVEELEPIGEFLGA